MVDELDYKLYQLLRENGRRTSTSLAKELGVSNYIVKKHVDTLIRENIMTIGVFIDPTKLEAPVGALIYLDVMQNDLDSTMATLAVNDSIARVSQTNGRYDLLAVSYFKSLDELSDFRIHVLSTMDSIKDLEIFILMHDGQAKNDKLKPLDAIDRQLIRLLRENGQQTNTVLARRLNLNRLTVRLRLKRLIDGGYIRIKAVLLDNRVNWLWRGAIGIKVRNTSIISVFQKLNNLPEVTFTAYTTGRFDMISDLASDSSERLYEVADREIPNLDGVIKSEFFICQSVKFGPQWESKSNKY